MLLWQLAAILINRPYILPPPLKVAASLVNLLGQPRFWSIFSGTLLRWLCGLIPAFLLGLLLGGLSAWSKSAGAFLQPFFTLVKSVPVVSITLLALIWFSAPLVPSFVVFLAVFPSISDNAAAGVKNIDHRLLDMAKVYHIEGHRRFFTIFLPSLQPFLFAALRTAVGIGLKATVVAELIVQPALSMGAELQQARVFLETDLVLAWTLLLVLCGYLAEKLIAAAETKALRWRG